MFYTRLSPEDVLKVTSGHETLDYDTARDLTIEHPETRVYAYVERVESPYIAGPLTPVKLSDLAPAIGFSWIGAQTVPITRK